KGLCHKSNCCDPCAPCAPVCVPMKTVKVWCPKKVWIEEPCTRTVRVCETIPETVQVTVMKKVATQQTRKVTVCKCVPECRTETYTVQVRKCVPYQATRTVVKCVPTCGKYTACRMVPRCVQKQVCDDGCSVSSTCGFRHGLRHKLRGHGCGSSCCN